MKKIKKRYIIILTLFIVAIIYMEYALANNHKAKTYSVKVCEVGMTHSYSEHYEKDGTIVANSNSEYTVALPYAVQIEEIYVSNGQHINAGDPLLQVKNMSNQNVETVNAKESGIVTFAKICERGCAIAQFVSIMNVCRVENKDDFVISMNFAEADYYNLICGKAENVSGMRTLEYKVVFPGSDNEFIADLVDNTPVISASAGGSYYNVSLKVYDDEGKLANIKLIEGETVDVLIDSVNSETVISDDNRTNSYINGGDGSDDEVYSYYEVPFQAIVNRDDKQVLFIVDRRLDNILYARMVIVNVVGVEGKNAVVTDPDMLMSGRSYVITEGNYELGGNEPIKIIGD